MPPVHPPPAGFGAGAVIRNLRRRIRRAWLELALLLAAMVAAIEAPRLPYRPYWLAAAPFAAWSIGGVLLRLYGDYGAIERLRRPYRLFIECEDL